MNSTGRLKEPITRAAQRIVFGAKFDPQLGELRYVVEVDRAHLVMLAECMIVDRSKAARLLKAIGELAATNFEALRGRPAPRGYYLAYEDYLIRSEGMRIGGILQTARSRNDLNATILKLRLRESFIELTREGLRLQAVLLRRARMYSRVVMPLFTNRQAAVPGTYGHYLAGIAGAFDRDLKGLMCASAGIHESPLGASVAGGTTIGIQPQRTAELLGFRKPVVNSLDAVASRDLVLRLLAASAIYGATLNRLAADLLDWSEAGFLEFPDRLVGSSSAMPQKRNPFLLEHVQGRSASPIGAFVTSASAIRMAPFTNSVAAGTEAVRPFWQAFRDVIDATVLLRLMIAGARLNQEVMLRRSVEGFTQATMLATLLMEKDLSFREAHMLTGEIVSLAADSGCSIECAATTRLSSIGITVDLDRLSPLTITEASMYGGGPSSTCTLQTALGLQHRWASKTKQMRAQISSWQAAHVALNAAVDAICRS